MIFIRCIRKSTINQHHYSGIYLINFSRFGGLFRCILPRYCNEVEVNQYYYKVNVLLLLWYILNDKFEWRPNNARHQIYSIYKSICSEHGIFSSATSSTVMFTWFREFSISHCFISFIQKWLITFVHKWHGNRWECWNSNVVEMETNDKGPSIVNSINIFVHK